MPLSSEQLALRKNKITATDAVAIVGLSPYRSSLDVYAEKIADGPAWEGNLATRIGERAEGMILDLLAEERGLVLAEATTEIHPILTWLAATPDRNVLERPAGDRIGVAEAKCVGFRRVQDWGDAGDEIPPYVHIQVQTQLTVTRTKRAYVAALMGTELRVFEVEHDQELSDEIVHACGLFWEQHIVPRIPPAPDGSDRARYAIERIFPRNTAALAVADARAEELAREYFEAKRKAAALAAEEERLANELRLAIGDHEGLEGLGWRATWKQTASNGTDWKAVAEELNAPKQLVAKYLRPGTRRFVIKKTG